MTLHVTTSSARAFLGRRGQASQASGAQVGAVWVSDTTSIRQLQADSEMVSDTHTAFLGTAKRREPRIAPPAASACGGGRLRRPGAAGGEGRA